MRRCLPFDCDGCAPAYRSALREEVRLVAGAENDREEVRITREQLAELAPPRPD